MARTAELRTVLEADLQDFSRAATYIRDKNGLLPRLHFNRAQREIHAAVRRSVDKTGLVRVCVLKARQQGSSTYFAARLFWRALLASTGLRAMCFAHTDEASLKLAGMVRTMYDQVPPEARGSASTLNSHEISYGANQVQFFTGGRSASNRGRGSTLDIAWLSEVCFMESAGDLLESVVQASLSRGSQTEAWIESTARGGPVGPWHSFWISSQQGVSGFEPVFLPWYWTDEYRERPPYGFELSREARTADMPSEYDYAQMHELDAEQMTFRRMKVEGMSAMGANGELAFAWEYPATADEAFLGGTSDSFIEPATVDAARRREIGVFELRSLPTLWGIDPAPPHGASATGWIKRRGPVAYDLERIRGLNLDELVVRIATAFLEEQPTRLYIDGSESYGQVLGHRLQSYAGIGQRVVLVQFGGRADSPDRFANKRAEMWYRMAQWLRGDVSIPDEVPQAAGPTLLSELLGPRLKNTELRIQLESKDQMRMRGVPSPDGADALAMTFADLVEPGSQGEFVVVPGPTSVPGPGATDPLMHELVGSSGFHVAQGEY